MEIKPQYWHTALAGKKGGMIHVEKNISIGGNPVTRLQKWQEWWNLKGKFSSKNVAILQRKSVQIPPHSRELAEFVGILLGDGGISKYQITITLNWIDDQDYLLYVRNLSSHLFNMDVKITRRKNQNVGIITLSRIDLVEYFTDMGLVIGNKVRQQVQVPRWITKEIEYVKYCIRGLFDTDGSFYIDRHKYKTTTYQNAALNFTNRSIPLLSFVKENLEKLDLHPTKKTSFAIFLRRDADLQKFFEIIGTSNPKHFNKFKKYAILRHIGRSTKAVTMAPTRNRMVPVRGTWVRIPPPPPSLNRSRIKVFATRFYGLISYILKYLRADILTLCKLPPKLIVG